MANSTSGESVIRRVVRLVGAFDDSHRTMSVATLARRSGLPLTTTYRLVDEMLAEGLLEREANAEVRIGTRLWELVSRSSRMVGLREAALPFMEDVQSVVRHSTTLGILESDEVLYIERIGFRDSMVDITKVAGRLPVHGTSSGLVLLAYSSAAYQELFLSRTLEKFTDATLTDPAELRRHFREAVGARRMIGACQHGVEAVLAGHIQHRLRVGGDQHLLRARFAGTFGDPHHPRLAANVGERFVG